MTRKPARRWISFGVAAASWVLTAVSAQGVLGPDIERLGHDLEERIEMQLRGGGVVPQPVQQPERSHEDSIEPWELVSV